MLLILLITLLVSGFQGFLYFTRKKIIGIRNKKSGILTKEDPLFQKAITITFYF